MSKLINSLATIKTKYKPNYDKGFLPIGLILHAYNEKVKSSGNTHPIKIALERNDDEISTYQMTLLSDSQYDELNAGLIERIIKSLLWIKGAARITIGGNDKIGACIQQAYDSKGTRAVDAALMSKIYNRTFAVEIADIKHLPREKENSRPIGGHLNGCRIGLDLGGSDRKVSAVIDGEAVYSEEVIWNPKTVYDTDYHYREILTALKTAAGHMPRVDAIGVSAAGIYIQNRVRVASLFKHLPGEVFQRDIKDIFYKVQKDMGNVPIVVVNDGEVTALAGALELKDTGVLGIAQGTGQASGYVDSNGSITGWLNELAFVPVDFSKHAALDEWSGDYGCGVNYFSQEAVIRLAAFAGIGLGNDLTPAQKLLAVQELLNKGDERAECIFEDAGIYLGYSIPYYAEFYDIKHLLLLGRVMSDRGGNIIVSTAQKILEDEFPDLSRKIKIHLPDEKSRRVGQSIAAASLTQVNI